MAGSPAAVAGHAPQDAVSADERARQGGFWILTIALLSVAVSLLVRLAHRGSGFAGCELIAAAVGHYLASTLPFFAVLREAFYQNRHYWLAFPVYPVPFVLIPGYLARLWPWEYWAHVATFASVVLTMILIARAADLPLRDWGVVVLGWGSSPMLLSYALVGEAWGSAFLPTALALWVTMNPRVRQRWFWAVFWCLVANELGWHVYEAGKLVGVVFIAAAILQRDVRLPIRAVWLLAGAAQVYEVLFLHPTANVKAFAFQQGTPWPAIGLNVDTVVRGLRGLAEAIITLEVDLPVLLVLGVASVLFLRRNRLLLMALLLVQLGLQLLIAMYGVDNMRPRRFIMVDGYCLACIACMYRDAGRLVRHAVVGALLLGNVWQGYVLYRFVHAPQPADARFTLPYIHSREGVGMIDAVAVGFTRELREHVDGGRRLLLLYNFSCYYENFTNPDGVLERLYLHYGHPEFVRSVFVFGSKACRYDCLPIHPLREFEAFLDGVRPDGPTPPATLVGYYLPGCKDAEGDAMFAEITRRFRITEHSPPGATIVRFTFDAMNDDGDA